MKQVYIAPDLILRYVINKKDQDIAKCLKTKKFKLVTSAFAFWEAFACLSEEEIKSNAKQIKEVLKLLPIVDTQKFNGTFEIQNKKRIKHLRGVALQ